MYKTSYWESYVSYNNLWYTPREKERKDSEHFGTSLKQKHIKPIPGRKNKLFAL